MAVSLQDTTILLWDSVPHLETKDSCVLMSIYSAREVLFLLPLDW